MGREWSSWSLRQRRSPAVLRLPHRIQRAATEAYLSRLRHNYLVARVIHADVWLGCELRSCAVIVAHKDDVERPLLHHSRKVPPSLVNCEPSIRVIPMQRND